MSESLPEFDRFRYRYEYGNESISNICSTEGYVIAELTNYAKRQGWQVVETPTKGSESDIKVNEYYSGARKELASQMIKRAMLMWPKMTELEDTLLDQTLSVLKDLNSTAEDGSSIVRNKSSELTKISKILTALQQSSQLYTEALIVSANSEKTKAGDIFNGDKLVEFAAKVKGAIRNIEGSITSTEPQAKDLTEQEASEIYMGVMKGVA